MQNFFGNHQLTNSFRLFSTSFDVSLSARARLEQNQMKPIRILCISNVHAEMILWNIEPENRLRSAMT